MQADPNMDVRARMINAGVMIIDKHGKENVPLLFPIFESYLNKKVCLIFIMSCKSIQLELVMHYHISQ